MSQRTKYILYTVLTAIVLLVIYGIIASEPATTSAPSTVNTNIRGSNNSRYNKLSYRQGGFIIMAENTNMHKTNDTLWEKTKDGASDTWEATKDVADDTWEGTKDVSGKVWDKTKEVSSDVWEGTKDGAAAVSDAVTGKE